MQLFDQYQEIPCKSNLQSGFLIALILFKSILEQPKLLYALPEAHLSNFMMIYQNFIQSIHTQIFNKNPQLMRLAIDLSLQFAVNFFHTQIFNKNLQLI